jgi:ribose-phosphate pyrophosphokinase
MPDFRSLDIVVLGEGPLASRFLDADTGIEGTRVGRQVWFPGGEGKAVINHSIREEDVYVFLEFGYDDKSVYDRLVMALHEIEAAVEAGAKQVTLVAPFFPGARQDKRKNGAREGISASLFARMIQVAGASRVLTLDIHNESIAGMFDPRICRLENLRPYMLYYVTSRHFRFKPEVIAAPDVGGLERARVLAGLMKLPVVAISKERDYSKPGTVTNSTVIGDVAGKNVLLFDDMIDTGGSIAAAYHALKGAGASGVQALATHLLLNDPASDRFNAIAAQDPGFKIWGTNSVSSGSHPYVQTIPIDGALFEAIQALQSHGSLSGYNWGCAS